MNIDFFTMTINNTQILYNTYYNLNNSIQDINLKDCNLYLNVDPFPNLENIDNLKKIGEKFFKDVIINIPKECNCGKAFKWGINNFKSDYLFMIEANKCIIKNFEIKNMIEKFNLNKNIVMVSLSPKKDKPILKYLTSHPSIWKKDWLKNINHLLSENINYEYQLRELALLDNKIGYTLASPNNIYINHIGKKYKEEKRNILANSSTDIEIANIVKTEGEWHKKILIYFANQLNKNKNININIINLRIFKKKIFDKEWIYRWTGKWKYVNDDKYYLRYLKESKYYLCNR